MKRMTSSVVEAWRYRSFSSQISRTLGAQSRAVLQLRRWLAHFVVDFTGDGLMALMASALQEESAPPVRGRRRSRGAEDS